MDTAKTREPLTAFFRSVRADRRRVEEGRGIETYWNRPVSLPRSSVGSRAGAIAPQARPICCSPFPLRVPH